MRPKPVGAPVDDERMEPRIAEDDLESRPSRGVTRLVGLDILLNPLEHRPPYTILEALLGIPGLTIGIARDADTVSPQDTSEI